MKIYGMLQLHADHSVHPDFVSLDHRGYPYVDLDGCELPPPINPTDIVGFGEDEIGEEAHIMIEMTDFGLGIFDPDETNVTYWPFSQRVVQCLDNLNEIREFFS